MARTSNRTDMPKIKKQKPFTGNTAKGMKFVDEWVIPHSAADAATYLIPYGKVAKGVVKGVKKVIKPATKVKKIASTAKDEIIMAKAGWNDAAKKNYRADVKRGTYNKTKKVTKTTKKK